MARRKKDSINISESELRELNIRKDMNDGKRASNGYIKVSLNSIGASILQSGIEDEIERKQKELEDLRKNRSRVEDISEKFSKKDKKKLKKEKKKKKKEKKRLKNMPESSKILFGAIQDYKDKYVKKDKKKDKGKDFDGVSSKEKKGASSLDDDEKREKLKEERDRKEFDKKFDEPLTLLRQGVVDVDKTLQEIDKLIDEVKEGRARNKHIMLKDLFASKIGLFGARANSARSMADIQKTRIDLQLKKVKEQGTSSDAKTQNIALMNKFFPQLIASGAMKKGKSDSDDDHKDKKKDKKKKDKYRPNEDKFEKRVASMIKDGDIELTPAEMNIEIEGKWRAAILHSYKNDDWKIIAIDNSDKIIRGFSDKYPGLLPKRKHLDLKIDTERGVAKCRRTDQVFPVISVPVLY